VNQAFGNPTQTDSELSQLNRGLTKKPQNSEYEHDETRHEAVTEAGPVRLTGIDKVQEETKQVLGIVFVAGARNTVSCEANLTVARTRLMLY